MLENVKFHHFHDPVIFSANIVHQKLLHIPKVLQVYFSRNQKKLMNYVGEKFQRGPNTRKIQLCKVLNSQQLKPPSLELAHIAFKGQY